MANHNRLKALDEIQKDPGWKTKWKTYNPLFRNFTPIFDDVFDRGSAPDLESYVDVKMSDGQLYAERLVQDLLGLQQLGRHEGRVYFLRGDVGRGKSIFSRHLVQDYVPRRHPKVIAVYADAYDMVQGREAKDKDTSKQPKTFAEFRESMKNAIVLAAVDSHKHIFKSECGFFRLLLTSKGYQCDSDFEVLSARDKISMDEVLDFLSSFEEVERVMIAVDNLDECSKEILDLTRSFVRNLAVRGSASPRAKKVAVLLPLRQYSINRFGDTKRYALDDLPEADYAKVFTRKIELLKELIIHDANTYEGQVSSAAFSKATKEHSLTQITYKIGPKGVTQFLETLARYLLTAHSERDFAPFLKSICAGNCKYLVAGLYNFLHSCKLPLTPLFGQAFLPDYANRQLTQVVPIGIAVECLMAIHYPFYDVDASSICNVFNAAELRAPNSFENTLAVVRLLCRIRNAEQSLSYGKLRQDFKSIGYHQKAVDSAFQKVCKFGLVASSEGYQMEDWNEETQIGATSATDVYLDVLLTEPSYLQYVSEDVLMPAEFVVSIYEKYGNTLIGSGSRTPRLESISRLIAFVEAEEQLEKERVLKKKRLKEVSFLERFGIKDNGGYLWLGGYLRNAVRRNGPRRLDHWLI